MFYRGAGCPFLFAVEAELEREHGQGENQADGVGQDDGDGVDEDSVEQPEEHTEGIDEEHGERNFAGAAQAPDTDELWDEGDGGADGSDESDGVDGGRDGRCGGHMAFLWRKK